MSNIEKSKDFLQKNAIPLSIGLVVLLLGYGVYRIFFKSKLVVPLDPDPNFPTPIITEQQARIKAQTIKSALSGADDEELIYEQFAGNLGINDVVLMNNEYIKLFNKSMVDELQSDLNSSEISTIGFLIGKFYNGNLPDNEALRLADELENSMSGLSTDLTKTKKLLISLSNADYQKVYNKFGERFSIRIIGTGFNGNLTEWLKIVYVIETDFQNALKRKFPNIF